MYRPVKRISDFERFIHDERACYKKCKDGVKCKKITHFFELLGLYKKCIQPSLFDNFQTMRPKAVKFCMELQQQIRKIKDCYHVRKHLQDKGYSYFIV